MAMNLSQKQLRLFVTLAQTQNMSRCAEQLCVTQPALTKALQEFESQLGVCLFDRTTRRMRLTHEGERFLPMAQRLLDDLQQAVKEVQGLSSGMGGKVVLAVGAAFATTLLPLALADFHAQHPDVSIRVIEDNSGGITSRVVHAEADVGIGTPVGDIGLLTCEALLTASLGVLGDPGVFRLRSAAAADDLCQLPLLKEPHDTSIAQVLRAHGSPLVARMEGGIEVSSLGLQIALASVGAGVAVVSALGASHPAAQHLRFVPLKPRLVREIFLMHRRDRTPSAATRALLQTIRVRVRSSIGKTKAGTWINPHLRAV